MWLKLGLHRDSGAAAATSRRYLHTSLSLSNSASLIKSHKMCCLPELFDISDNDSIQRALIPLSYLFPTYNCRGKYE